MTSSRKPRRRPRTDETEDAPKKPRDHRRMRAILRILGADPDVNATYLQLCAQHGIDPDGDE